MREERLDISQKILLIDAEKCTGCRICEIICSLHHEGECNPAKSRIHIIKWDEAGIDVPMLCQQCEIPLCEDACPVKAIYKDVETGALLIKDDVCNGCKICISFCPFGGISLDTNERKIVKCDLCGGDPKCVDFCPTEALRYAPVSRAIILKKRESAVRIGELMTKLVFPKI